MSTRHSLSRISVDDYLQGELLSEIRHEYIDGQLYAMAGAGERHNRIAMNAAYQLRGAARGGRCGVYMSDMKVRVRDGLVTGHEGPPIVEYRPGSVLCLASDGDAGWAIQWMVRPGLLGD